jgi:hypothetical protein
MIGGDASMAARMPRGRGTDPQRERRDDDSADEPVLEEMTYTEPQIGRKVVHRAPLR